MPSPRPLARFWSVFGALAHRRHLVIALSGILTFLGCLVVNASRGHDPIPEIHDEHAYLLAGDTFAHCRLTNPPHPVWKSLETFHQLQRPTYQAKYPPGQGLFLALGQMLTGRPIVGVWISCSLLVAALCWMLYAWVPPRWAVIGTVLGATTLVFSGRGNDGGALAYWSQSYWGGAPAALGGAILFGGLRHAIDRGTWASGIALGSGASLLGITRPYEGALCALAAGAMFAATLVRRRSDGARLLRIALPAACIAGAALGWIGYYNARVTGDALRFPYAEHDRQYEIARLWRWQPVREEPPGLNRPMQDFARWEVESVRWSNDPRNRAASLYRTLAFEVGPILAPAILALLPWTLRSRRIREAGLIVLVVTGGTLLVNYYQTHYHAPAAPLVVLVATLTLRRLALMRLGGRRIGFAIALLVIAATVANAGREWWAESRAPERLMSHWASLRAGLEQSIPPTAGGHVIFVRYGPRHSPHLEVVFNRADIDGSPVVWVRDLGPEQNAAVLAHYPGRNTWLLAFEDDRADPRLFPYGGRDAPAPAGVTEPGR